MARDLIVFGEDWGGLPSSTQHLVRHLAGQRKVLWVNSIGLRQPRLNRRDFYRLWHKLRRDVKPAQVEPVETPGQNFRVLQPVTLPAPRSTSARWLARKLLLRQIKPVVASMDMHEPVLWTSLPTAVDLVGHLGESATVYYCGDDFSALAGVDHGTVAKREVELTLRADLIIAASERLFQRFPLHSTRLLTHGVDYPLFATPVDRAVDFPALGKPVAGFYGSISEWLDIELMDTVIGALPQWHFLFIGRAVVDVSRLSRHANVTFLGPRPHRDLPTYSQHWQASLLPFRRNAQIDACNPLKLSEYLATGRPIVSTSFPALAPYSDLVQEANDAYAMIGALELLRLSAPGGPSVEMQARVAQHGWQQRAECAGKWLDQL